MTIEESMHVKFEESNPFVKNVVDAQIELTGEELKKIPLMYTSTIKVNQGKEQIEEVQEEQHEEAQPLHKDSRYASSH